MILSAHEFYLLIFYVSTTANVVQGIMKALMQPKSQMRIRMTVNTLLIGMLMTLTLVKCTMVYFGLAKNGMSRRIVHGLCFHGLKQTVATFGGKKGNVEKIFLAMHLLHHLPRMKSLLAEPAIHQTPANVDMLLTPKMYYPLVN